MVAKAVENLAGALKSRPEAALCGLAMITPALLIPMGVNPWAAMFAPAGVYVVYCVRAIVMVRMELKKADARILQTQADGETRLAKVLERAQKLEEERFAAEKARLAKPSVGDV